MKHRLAYRVLVGASFFMTALTASPADATTVSDLPSYNEGGSFLLALSANAPAADIAGKMMLYGRFIGAWEGRSVYHKADGTCREESCEVHFGWALDGRAVQDVWIAPARKDRVSGKPGTEYSMYGTTLRVYDAKNDNWQITWVDASHPGLDRMTGKQVGEDIIQEYRQPDGLLCQWCFTEITPDSFHWIGRGSKDDGKTWFVESEYILHRVQQAAGK